MSMIIIWTVGIINHVQFHSCSNSCFFSGLRFFVLHVFIMCLATEKGCYRYNLSQSVCTFFTLQVSTLPAVDWATSCLGQILRIGLLGSQNIQFANPVGCAGWCNSQRKIEVGGFFVVHTATKLSGNEVYTVYIYTYQYVYLKSLYQVSQPQERSPT